MKGDNKCNFLRLLGAMTMLAAGTFSAQGANQTSTVSPIVIGGNLPYKISLSVYDFNGVVLPMIHSFALGIYQEKWVIVSGRTNGMHPLAGAGFPPQYQNKDIYVIDPVAKTVKSRSLSAGNSGLTQEQIDALSATNTESVQIGDRLYVAGGYYYDSGANMFTTYDKLTVFDLPGVVDWVENSNGMLVSHIRQTTDAIFKVAGGALHVGHNGRPLMIFGADYVGPYSAGNQPDYTERVRNFDLNDTGPGGMLSVSGIGTSTIESPFHRRDLNVVQMMILDAGIFYESFIAFSGVFTLTTGIWTIPVEISAFGSPITKASNDPAAFKQGMNNYECANISLFSEKRNETHTILLGGISYGYYDTSTGTIAYDPQFPFINSMSSIVRTKDGTYTQYYLGEFPNIPNPNNGNAPFLFGTNAEFIPAAGIPSYPNGMLKLDALTKSTVIGYVFGGIAAQQPNGAPTAGSNVVFQVNYSPPVSPALAPFIKVSGKKVRHSSSTSFIVRGLANSSTSNIEWRLVGKKKFRKKAVQANGKWKVRVNGLQPGKNVVQFRGVSANGQQTPKRKVTIFRD